MRSRARAYTLAIAALAGAVLLRWLLDPLMGDALPLVTLFGAVAAAVAVGGYRPAVLIGALGYLACAYLFIAPRGSFRLDDFGQVVGLVAYVFTCLLIIGFGEAMRRSQLWASERRELLRVTLGSIGDAVITTDTAGCVTYLNEVAESLTGWTQPAALGQPLDAVFRIVNETTRDPVENPANRVLREGVVVGLAHATVLVRKDGTECPIDDSAAPIRNEQGQISGCVLIFRDITAQRRSDQAKASQLLTARLLAAIVDSSDDAIISKTLGGIIQSWNAAAERLFGFKAEEAVGRHISLVIPPERIAEEDLIVSRLKAGQRVDHFETERMRSDGRRILVSLTISPIKDEAGNVVGASKIVRDVTLQRQAEERAITERKRLEDDLRRLAVDLSDADRRKDEFLATLAHELRNPLAPLSNMLEVLKRSGGDAQTLQRARETMERQLGQMVRLVDDLLDLNRITRNRLELRKRTVELASVLQQAVETARPLIDAAGHELRVTLPAEPVHLDADAARLAQVFGNLLNNSCKYTGHGGTIWLTAERLGSEVAVTVKDTGIGIPPGQLESIFEMFSQVDRSLERSQGGLGIGLTLVKRMVQLHGGSIVARSAGEGMGSEFVVRLPVLTGVTRILAPELAIEIPPSRAHRILIVDDNLDSADSLAMFLKLIGHETFTADDGVEAMEAIELQRPEVVLLDIGLPKLNGHEVCRRVREQAWGKEIVLIALTG